MTSAKTVKRSTNWANKPTGHYVESKQIDLFCELKDNWLLKWISESSFQYSFSLDQRQGESYL